MRVTVQVAKWAFGIIAKITAFSGGALFLCIWSDQPEYLYRSALRLLTVSSCAGLGLDLYIRRAERGAGGES